MFPLLDSAHALGAWLILVVASLARLQYDLRINNCALPSLMQWVWRLTVLYSGPVGLLIYYATGRSQISRDSLWRRSFRSVAHCYAGCGAGEVAGVFIAAGLLGLGNLYVSGITFALAYVAGFLLTVGPLTQAGVPFGRAVRDSFLAETVSITVMEITAIGIGLWLGGGSSLDSPRFWLALYVSLSAGLFAAYPVNVLLFHFGVKEGMHDPRRAASHGNDHGSRHE